MDAEGCRHRPETSTRCPACEIDALPRKLTEAQRRLKGWTNHAELAEYVIVEVRQKLVNHRAGSCPRRDEVLVSQKAIAAHPGTSEGTQRHSGCRFAHER
jgi:hypothetical protein